MIMKRVGSVLMLLGAGIGGVAVLGIGGAFHLAVPWLVGVGLAKLTLAASAGVMATGAFVRRVGLRREEEAHLASPATHKLL
jgi:hypothetical protein